jgi:hypothetical protein
MQTIDGRAPLLLITRASRCSFWENVGRTYRYILPYLATYMICTLPLADSFKHKILVN